MGAILSKNFLVVKRNESSSFPVTLILEVEVGLSEVDVKMVG